nr:acyl-CoA dehydrogenase family protein [Paenibacillus xylanexedens]
MDPCETVEFSENIVRSFHSFVDQEIIPFADEFDKHQQIPRSLIQSFAQEGYLGAIVPSEFGGMELDAYLLGKLAEELGRGCSSLRSLLTVHGMVAMAITKWGTTEQKQQWLPTLADGSSIGAFALSEPSAGSDIKAIQTTASYSDGKYLLNGTKKWITFGQIADIFLLFAKLNGEITAFLVPRNTKGLHLKPIYNMLGTRASMLAEIELKECEIPAANIVGRVGAGGTYIAPFCLDFGRYTIAWGCVGIAQACLDASLQYVNERIQFDVRLIDNQLIKKMLTEMLTDVKAARFYCNHVAQLKKDHSPDAFLVAWEAKYAASKAAVRVSNHALQIHGAYGCSGESSLSRYMRDARVMEIIEGTSQISELIIAEHAFQTLN